jgi:outer membrane protein insertion porin family
LRKLITLILVFTLILSFSSVTFAADNEKMFVEAIEIDGNEQISDEEILAVISTKVGSYVTGDDIRNDLIAIYEMGYFQQEPIAKVPPYKNGIKIIYSVQENVVVDRIEITGNTLISDEEIQSRITAETGKVFNSRKFNTDLNSIAQAYYEKGHSIGLKDISFDEQTRTLKVELGEYRVGEIRIIGNEKTKDYVLWREVTTKSGDFFDNNKLMEDMRRIYNLGFFEEVSRELEETEDFKFNITIIVKELKTAAAEFGGGYSSVDGLFGWINMDDQNFLGRAYGLKFLWEFGGKKNAYEIGFYDPWFGGTNMGLSLDVYDRVYRREESGSAYDIWRRGVEAGLSKYLDVYTTVGGKFRMEDSELRRISGSITPEPRTSIRSLKFIVNRDCRDNFLDPKTGYSLTGSIELAGGILGGDSNFTKYEFEGTTYLKGFQNHVIALRGVLGFLSSTVNLPHQELFFVGGPGTLRGFDYGTFKGDKMLVMNAEYRIPIDNTFQGVIFLDAGKAWEKDKAMTLSDINSDVGIGLRMKLPIGLILGIDFAYSKDGLKTSFNFGQGF